MQRVLIPICCLVLSTLLFSLVEGSFVPPPVLPNSAKNNVYLRLQSVAVFKIDGVVQTFQYDFFMTSIWQAPLPAGSNLQCISFDQCSTVSSDDVTSLFWTPQLEFINGRGDLTRMKEEPYKLMPDSAMNFTGDTLRPGWVWIQEDQRYQSEYATPMNMNAFPFDIQHLDMILETTWESNLVELKYATPTQLDDVRSQMTQVIGWTFKDQSQWSSSNLYLFNGASYSRFTYRQTYQRQPQYYLTKIVIGTMLLVWMCIWNFSMQVDVSDRMMGTLQVFSGLIAFLFVAGGDTPKLPYQTRLDVFMLFSFFIVASTMLYHSILYYFREVGFEGSRAEKLEKLEAKKRRLLLARLGKLKMKKDEDIDLSLHKIEMVERKLKDGNKTPIATTSDAEVEVEDDEDEMDVGEWELRLHSVKDWTLTSWFAGLNCTRKWDALVVPSYFIFYTVGSAIILGRPPSDGVHA